MILISTPDVELCTFHSFQTTDLRFWCFGMSKIGTVVYREQQDARM